MTVPLPVCVQYARPNSGQGENEVYGLDVAVTNLLTAYFKYGTAHPFICRPNDLPSFDHFKELAIAAGHDAESKVIGLDPRSPGQNLARIGCMFRPDPLTVDLIWRRQQVPAPGFATCGLVHTMSGERIARAVGDLCLAPSDGFDALICPSPAIRDAVRQLWDIHADYLNHRFGGTYRCAVQTPVIPLGVDTAKFRALASADKRVAQRAALGVADNEVVLLFMGRLSFATKAHPLPLWLAAKQAARKMKRQLRVVMLGYFKPKDMEQHFKGLAAEILKTVPVEFIANNDPHFPDGLWAGADLFISLADNIQESFGLTPVEAMAAGLPVIASDWDGYRASVRHQRDGFLIPTIAPPASAGMAIAESYYNMDNYGVSLTGASQSTAVDIKQCAEAIYVLAEDEAKRASFADSARRHAESVFDWRHIIRAYESLWQELAARRQAHALPAALPPNWQAVHPAYPNPLQMFGGFASATLTPQTRIGIVMSAEDIEIILKHEMNFFLPELLVHPNSMRALIEAIRQAGTPYTQDILAPFPENEHNRIWRCIGWIVKHGVGVVA